MNDSAFSLQPSTLDDPFRRQRLLSETYQGDSLRMLVCEGIVITGVEEFRGLVARGLIYRTPDGTVQVVNRNRWGGGHRPRAYLGYSSREQVVELVHFVLHYLPEIMEAANLKFDHLAPEDLRDQLIEEVPIK